MRELSTCFKLTIEKVDRAILRGVALWREGIDLTYRDRKYLLSLSRKILEKKEVEIKKKKINIKNVIVFVSIYENDQILACAYRQGKTFLESVILSTQKAVSQIKKKINTKKIHLEIVILLNKKNVFPEQIILGLDAICLEYKNKMAIFKNSVPVKYGYSLQETFTKLAEKCGIHASVNLKKADISTYRTIEFREDILTKNNRHGLYDLYRSNPLILQKEVTKKSLKICLYHTYCLLKKICVEKKFQTYLYIASKKKWSDSSHPEAYLRKIASIWIFAKLANFYQDKVSLDAIEKAIISLMKHFKFYQKYGCMNIKNICDIGINGCMLLLLATSGFHQDKISLLRSFILSAYDEKCQRLIPIITPQLEMPHESEYFFPGIALTALSVITKSYPENTTILENVFPYYLALFRKNKEGVTMLQWMSSAYSELFFITKKNKYAEFVFEMNDIILNQQMGLETLELDLIGSFSTKGNAGVTASILESLIDAYRLAKYLKDNSRIKSYGVSILMGMRFILQSQHRPDNTFDVNIVGGFKHNFFDNNVRIDYIQHCAHAIYKYLHYC